MTDGESWHFETPRLLWSKYSSFGLLHLDMVLWGSINFRDKDIIYNLEYNVNFPLIYKPFVSFIILFFKNSGLEGEVLNYAHLNHYTSHHKTCTYRVMKTLIENVSINSIQFNLFHFLSIVYKVKDYMEIKIVTI
jgi:hypothetical protein